MPGGHSEQPATGCHDDQDNGDEQQLAHFDPQIKGQERGWNIAFGQADFAQRAGESKAVDQAKAKGDQPWPLLGQPVAAVPGQSKLIGQKDDGQGDDRLDRGGGKVSHPSEAAVRVML